MARGEWPAPPRPGRDPRLQAGPPPLPEVLFEDECRRLLSEASHDSRSYLLVLLLLEAGLKREELLKLKSSDFDTANPYRPELWVRPGKRYKARRLRLPPEVPAMLAAYTAEYRPQEILFDCSERNLGYILKQLPDRVGIAKRVSCQSLRDTFAVRQLRAGESIERVLEKLAVPQAAIDKQGWPQAAPSYTPRSLRCSTWPGARELQRGDETEVSAAGETGALSPWKCSGTTVRTRPGTCGSPDQGRRLAALVFLCPFSMPTKRADLV